MERRKLTKEDIDKVRNIEGFPIGTDEDIIALSDAPFYTACPNPFIEDFIKEYGTPYDEATDDYHREPFAADVSEGKADTIYNAHSYHTKVPYKAIMRYILHYTEPGDIVFDGFCGTGMAAVAAQMCGEADSITKAKLNSEMPKIKFGRRKAVISDIAPAATFIAYNYTHPIKWDRFEKEANSLLSSVEKECAWMYKTKHTSPSSGQMVMDTEDKTGVINYIIWSDVFICPHCGNEIVFWNAAVDRNTGRISDDFSCTHCGIKVSKKDCDRAKQIIFDHTLSKTIQVAKQVPVQINYSYCGKRYEKAPDEDDFRLIEKIDSLEQKYWYPKESLPDGDKTSDPRSVGVERIYQFYTPRTLYVLSALVDKISEYDCQKELMFVITGILQISSKMSRFRFDSRNPKNTAGGILNGTLYIPSLSRESNVFENFKRRFSPILSLKQATSGFVTSDIAVSTNSLTQSTVPDNCIDYIFTDPPFGANINYSELSFIWEPWLRVITNSKKEAIISQKQQKKLPEYQELMEKSFAECYRILKPNHWMTVEFHNSKNAIWNAIQEALLKPGFIIADVRTLDKKQGSYNQVKGASQAIKQDLVISVYKPTEKFRGEIEEKAGNEDTAWAFVRQHLANIPVVVVKNDHIEVVAERQAYLLFDRMVAYHIMQGIPVPLDATDFYRGLDEKFLKRDNMYFLPDQVNEYDTARITTEVENIQFELFVTNEKSAISWLYQQLDSQFCGPQTYAELQPKFMQEVKAVDKYEQMPELAIILEENFLQDEKGRWYIPDVTKEGDLVKLREKNLWKEFEGYMNSKGKLKLFRSEAIRVGFSRLWKEKNYKAIVDIAERLPEQTIQEDANLLMYYDISLGRV